MELFIPSLLVLLVGAIVCFVLMPSWSPYTLGMLSFGLLAIGIMQHYSTFPYEYKLAYLQEAAKDYSPFIMIAAVIIGGMIATMLAFGGNPPSVASMATSLPAVPSFGPSTPANNKGANNKGAASFNLGGNNAKRNNLASNSFKTV
jgi:hypothetical protein